MYFFNPKFDSTEDLIRSEEAVEEEEGGGDERRDSQTPRSPHLLDGADVARIEEAVSAQAELESCDATAFSVRVWCQRQREAEDEETGFGPHFKMVTPCLMPYAPPGEGGM